MQLKFKDMNYHINISKIYKIIKRYLQRYADFDKFIASLPAVSITEKNGFKLIKYNRTKAFILINNNNKKVAFYKKIPKNTYHDEDKHFLEFLGSLYNNKEWNIIYDYTYYIRTFNKVYGSVINLINKEKITYPNIITDNIVSSPEKLLMKAKIKNLNARYRNQNVVFNIANYTIPNSNTDENYYRTGSKLYVDIISDSSFNNTFKEKYIYICKLDMVYIGYN